MSPSPRRTRAPIACQRCKRRKTKCNGEIPVCSACKKSGTSCIWPSASRVTIPQTEEQSQMLQYTAQLEGKVAELESQLKSQQAREQPNHLIDDLAHNTPGSASSTPFHVNYNGELSTDLVLLSMNATAEPFFVGPTSGFSLSKLVEGILSAAEPTGQDQLNQHLQTDNQGHLPSAELDTVSIQAEDTLIETYFHKVHSRYPFLDRSSFYERLNRQKITSSDAQNHASELFILYMVCAVGSRVVKLHPEIAESASPEIYFAKALRYIDAATTQQSLLRIQALLLLAIYLLRTPGSVSNLGSWHIIGLAVRCAVEMGLHRNFRGQQGKNHSLYSIEVRRRTFWSAYILDRAVSLTLGRPFALAEHDIDVALPLDIDDTTTDENVIKLAQQNGATGTFSTLSSFIHMCRLRRIESKIQHEIFGAGDEIFIPDSSYDEKIDLLRRMLDSWREVIPVQPNCELQGGRGYSIYDTKEFLNIQYSKALRMLLQPRITTTRYSPNDDKTAFYFSLSARAAGDICQYYKTLHQRRPLGWNLLALHSIFMAGLTLLYCIWALRETPNLSVLEDIRACSNVLFAISERWPTANRFRDVFEVLTKKLMETVMNGEVPATNDCEGHDLEQEMDFASPGFESFWTIFDDLVDDEYIRDQFRFDEGENSAFMGFSTSR
ncbi:fungal-specific transcription factor domain-containing protein [Talaromyces proteolyticus]|uniref:Fungal-specific transcription factor domain-containing protein n=1 Tax=Talaromyces proteolyticus TaxID=1131652 RepID=A0AAD4L8M6_9EURO|nr:fungal-specific transcription factor domain-containing protein [Talaromyces proteolyticus]KAH8705919.1 fungal-specific transcription factor domain-containing protein [Talaromyces proteolyticus]